MHLKTVNEEKMASNSTKLKRNTSAYILFTKDIRDEVRRENPGLKVGDLTLLMSKKWNEAKANNPEIIAKYTKLAEQDKERYISEKEERMLQDNDDIVFSDSSSSPSLDLTNRKRCPSAWTLFCKANEKDFIQKYPKMKKREINNLLKTEWEEHVNNKDDIMKKFNAKAKQYLKQLNTEKCKDNTDTPVQVNDTTQEYIDPENNDIAITTLKQTKHVTFSDSVNFEPRKISDFEKYSMQNRARVRDENKHLTPREITRLLAKLWKKSVKRKHESYYD